MTIEDIFTVTLEVKKIRRDAVKMLGHRDGHFWQRYETLKGRLNREVGWYCPAFYPDWMHTVEAHDLAYHFVFEGLT